MPQNVLYLFKCSSDQKIYENEITSYKDVTPCSQIASSITLKIRVNRFRQNCKFYQTTRYYIPKDNNFHSY
jgi:hypothetical protein